MLTVTLSLYHLPTTLSYSATYSTMVNAPILSPPPPPPPGWHGVCVRHHRWADPDIGPSSQHRGPHSNRIGSGAPHLCVQGKVRGGEGRGGETKGGEGRRGEGGMMLELVWSVGHSHWSSLGRPSPIAQVKMNVSVNSTALHVFSHHIVSCVPCHSSVWCDCM